MDRPSATAQMLRMLRAAGCDTNDEHELQMGMIAYSVAQMVPRNSQIRVRPTSGKSRTGRNDPCPCGSGKKYKKCCLDKQRDPRDESHFRTSEFGPECLPRIWDEQSVADDLAILVEIMDRDPAFAKMYFSEEGVASFMDAILEKDPSFADGAEVGLKEKLDRLAVRYVRESGEGNVAGAMKDNALAALPRAKSNDEVRALVTALCLAFMEEASREAGGSGDAETSLLDIVLFRRALYGAVRSMTLCDDIMGQLGGDREQIRRLLENDDPSTRKAIDSFADSLSPSDRAMLENSIERDWDKLWRVISSGEFPVPMPFATQLAFIFRLMSSTRTESPSTEAITETMAAFADELIEEDHVLYSRMLDRWLKDCDNRSGDVAKAVQMLAGLCAIRSMEKFVPRLLIISFRQKVFVPFDEGEQPFIDQYTDSHGETDSLAQYGAWLASKGFPGMANRLLAASQDQVSTVRRTKAG